MGAVVLRLLLHPDDLPRLRVARQGGRQRGRRERVELLEAEDGGRGVAAPLALGAQLVEDLPGGDQDPPGPGRHPVVLEHRPELPARQFVDRRGRRGVSQHALGREHHERLAPLPEGLAPQQVEVLRRGRGLGDLEVVLGGQLEEPLDARARVFGPLALVAVGEQQDEAGEEAPLVLARAQELVDDHLGVVGEVAELRLPQHERLGVVAAEAVLVAEDGGLRQRRVVDLAPRLVRREVRQRHVLPLVLDVDEDGVPLVEGAAFAVLPGQPHPVSRRQQRGERERFRHAVVEAVLSLHHRRPLLEQFLHLRVHVEVGRPRGELRRDGAERVEANPRLHLVRLVVAAAVIRRPVLRQLREGDARLGLLGLLLRSVVLVADAGRRVAGLEARAPREHLPQRGVGLDRLVHQRLRDRRVVHLAVAVPAVADQVDDRVGPEGVAELGGDPRHPDHGREVFAVHVEDRDGQAARQVGGERRGVQLAIGGREAEQVVHHDVDGPPDPVARQVAQVQRLGRHPLPGERRVAVQHDRHDAPGCALPLAGLPRAGAPERHRVDRLEVARVRHQLHAQLVAAPGAVGAGRPHVVLHVAAAQHALRVGVLEPRVHVARGAPHGVDHHVEAAAVAHADQRLAQPEARAGLEHLVEQRDQRGDAFQGEALRAGVAAVQDDLEGLGPQQALEDGLPIDRGRRLLHPLLHPAPPPGIGDVHELDPDRAAVPGARAGGRLAGLDQVGVRARVERAQRVEVGLEVSPPAEGVENRLVAGTRLVMVHQLDVLVLRHRSPGPRRKNGFPKDSLTHPAGVVHPAAGVRWNTGPWTPRGTGNADSGLVSTPCSCLPPA